VQTEQQGRTSALAEDAAPREAALSAAESTAGTLHLPACPAQGATRARCQPASGWRRSRVRLRAAG